MARTGFYCKYELKDVTAIADSTPESIGNQSFANLSLVKDNVETAHYATLEQNFFILDGTRAEMPAMPTDIVFFSEELSDAEGYFQTAPELIISFTMNHASCGLTLYFQDEHPQNMTIRWYDEYDILIASGDFVIDALEYFARQQVENYRKIVVTFTRAAPYRYVKLRYIEYGTDLIMGYGGMPVKNAKLTEETDGAADKIAVNKLSYSLIDEEDDFNVGNIAGLHKVMQKRQQMRAYEIVDGVQMPLGVYYLDSFKTNKNVTTISAVDRKGILDDHRFMGGAVYIGAYAGDVIESILLEAGITQYEIEDSVKDVKLHGWLKIQTCRKALREVLFACGALIDSRGEVFRIYKPDRQACTVIERARKFSTTVSDKDYISDVCVKYAEYIKAAETSDIVKGAYGAGDHMIEFSSPAADMTIDVGEILEQTNNYVRFRLEAAAEIVITGYKYTKAEYAVTESESAVDAGMAKKTQNYSCSVVSMDQARVRAKELLEYSKLRIGIKAKFLNAVEMPGMWTELQNSNRTYGNYAAGIEKLTTELTGGFISTAELRGYYKLISDFYYTGELMAGEETGIL